MEFLFWWLPVLIGVWFTIAHGPRWVIGGLLATGIFGWLGLIPLMILVILYAEGVDPPAPTQEETWRAQSSFLSQHRSLDVVPDGWHPDPVSRYTWRYYDGRNWTQWVSDGDQTIKFDNGE